MAQAAAVAGVASIASLGFKAAGDLSKGEYAAEADIAKGQATKVSDDFQAGRAERAAAFGEIQAGLTDTTARENLNTTLGNIDVIRAAAGIDPTSPTTAAILDRNTGIADRQRMAAVGSIKAQSAEDLASADYLRKAGDFAVKQSLVAANNDKNMSYLNAGADIFSGVSKAFKFGDGAG